MTASNLIQKSDDELCAIMAERIGFRFEAMDGGTAFRLITLERDTMPWRSTIEQAWADSPRFVEDRRYFDEPEILIPLGANAWAYWTYLNEMRDGEPATQRQRVIAFILAVPKQTAPWTYS